MTPDRHDEKKRPKPLPVKNPVSIEMGGRTFTGAYHDEDGSLVVEYVGGRKVSHNPHPTVWPSLAESMLSEIVGEQIRVGWIKLDGPCRSTNS